MASEPPLQILEALLERLICRRHCHWFKETRREVERCAGFTHLAGLVAADPALAAKIERLEMLRPGAEGSRPLRERLCAACPFRAEGCDFAAGLAAPPCGGYLVARALRE